MPLQSSRCTEKSERKEVVVCGGVGGKEEEGVFAGCGYGQYGRCRRQGEIKHAFQWVSPSLFLRSFVRIPTKHGRDGWGGGRV